MIVTASLSLFCLIASALLAGAGLGARQAVVHLAVAAGIVPLIFGAMIYFVPVLTRTGDPGGRIGWLPRAAQLNGFMIAATMQHWLPYPAVHAGALIDLALALVLLRWIVGRASATLGSPHPGWRWYAVALTCLALGLTAVIALAVWPAFWRPLRLFHLHLNLLAFVGLAALGTLPVLLPTALARPDPEVAAWLRRRLWLVAFGALVLATGAAIDWTLAVPGAALLLVVILGLGGQWARRFGLVAIVADGVAASLSAAVCGLIVALAAGVLHGAGYLAAYPALPAWGAGFLLPLVTGAISQLLPVWRWPGPGVPQRVVMRQRLAASGAWRGALFIAGELAILSDKWNLAGGLIGCGLALFLIGAGQAMRVPRSTR